PCTYTLSLHDALPISGKRHAARAILAADQPGPEGEHQRIAGLDRQFDLTVHRRIPGVGALRRLDAEGLAAGNLRIIDDRHGCARSEEHTSELQSLAYL